MKYTIGVDFGTLSARALVVEVDTGRELASAVFEYPHGVMDERLPDGSALPPDWALQHPSDYLDALSHTIPEALRLSGVSAADVIGLGIDFTACTMLPVDRTLTPLCLIPGNEGNPHTYIKLWKHHAAQPQANRLNEIARQRGEAFLPRYGGKISSEWMFPKIMQILDEAPEVYEATARFMEAGDWVISTLTGVESRNACMAGYKSIWHKKDGYPSADFFGALDARLRDVIATRFAPPVPQGTRAGGLTEKAARLTGLPVGTAVAVSNVDAHVAAPATRVTRAGQMLMIIGTSTCHMLLGDAERNVPGMCGVVEDGIIPGLMGYEAGQSCVGDHFGWFVENCVPEGYVREAAARNQTVHQLLTDKSAAQKPGAHGLVALDWWNGNRSVLVDADLTGVIVGMTLLTRPEDIYRALIEATAYGTRMIIETFESAGVPITELIACGGIAKKNAMMMQIYADVTGRTVRVARSDQAPALGSAMFGAVAAGKANGGYDDIFEATDKMACGDAGHYAPVPDHVRAYEALYQEYKNLHDEFGRGANDVLKRLKEIKRKARSE